MTTVDVVEAVLRERIERGKLAPGMRVADAELARELEVSRTPVREALLRLSRDGLIEIAPARWTRVTGLEDLELVFAPYAALHGVAAAAAARRLAQAPVAEAERCLERLRADNADLHRAIRRKDAEGARAADERFHDVIVEWAANPHLTRTLMPLRSLVRRYELAHFAKTAPALASHDQHDGIVAALAARDAAEAERLTRQNMTP
jgi:DNA-binding GntR family transcriptional regulator